MILGPLQTISSPNGYQLQPCAYLRATGNNPGSFDNVRMEER